MADIDGAIAGQVCRACDVDHVQWRLSLLAVVTAVADCILCANNHKDYLACSQAAECAP